MDLWKNEKLVLTHFHFHNSLINVRHGGFNRHIRSLVSQAGAFRFASGKGRSRALGHLRTEVFVALGADVNNPHGAHVWRLLLVEGHLEQHGHLVGGGSRRGVLEIVSDDADRSVTFHSALCEQSLSWFAGPDAGGRRVGALSALDVHAVKWFNGIRSTQHWDVW